MKSIIQNPSAIPGMYNLTREAYTCAIAGASLPRSYIPGTWYGTHYQMNVERTRTYDTESDARILCRKTETQGNTEKKRSSAQNHPTRSPHPRTCCSRNSIRSRFLLRLSAADSLFLIIRCCFFQACLSLPGAMGSPQRLDRSGFTSSSCHIDENK